MADANRWRDRLDMRLDAASQRRLEALVEHLELTRSAVVRQALRYLAEREGLEQPRRPPPDNPPA